MTGSEKRAFGHEGSAEGGESKYCSRVASVVIKALKGGQIVSK